VFGLEIPVYDGFNLLVGNQIINSLDVNLNTQIFRVVLLEDFKVRDRVQISGNGSNKSKYHTRKSEQATSMLVFWAVTPCGIVGRYENLEETSPTPGLKRARRPTSTTVRTTNLKSRINSGNACYHAVQNLLSSCLLSKNVKIKT
jgi:hypothetical protein